MCEEETKEVIQFKGLVPVKRGGKEKIQKFNEQIVKIEMKYDEKIKIR